MKYISYCLLVMLIMSCQTRQDIERARIVENLNVAVKDQSKITADTTSKLQSIEENLSRVVGEIEERNYKKLGTFGKSIEELEKRIKIIEESSALNAKKMSQISAQMKKQEKYIKSVLKGLKSMRGTKHAKTSSKKGSTTSAYNRAMLNYKKGYYKSAKRQLLALFDNKKIKGSKRARVIHNLGMIEYRNKKHEKALSYFSILYSKMPDSSYNKSGLLHMAKTFRTLGQKEEAREILKELRKKFPGSKQAKEAKKMISKL